MTACITNRCSQGHAPCPTPGVCNGNTLAAIPAHTDDQTHTVEEASIWILGAACLLSIAALIGVAAGVLSVPL